MSLESIIAENRTRALQAAETKKTPFIFEKEDRGAFPPFPFPHIGSFIPEGWRKSEEYFVDSSGFGTVGESALTAEQFAGKMIPGRGYAITEAGQFQVYVSEFVRVNGAG